MDEQSYWKTRQRRLSRRRFVQATAATAGSAGLLAACGGGKSRPTASNSATAGGSSAAGTPKRGGELTAIVLSTTANLNPVTNYQEGYVLSGVNVYDRLISTRPNLHFSNQYRLEAAASVEQPDDTTVIFKLKPGMKYQNAAPVNGRDVVTDDIVKSQIYVRDNPKAENNSFQRGSMDSVSAPDPQTAVFKLKAPNAYLFSGTQMANSGAQCIIPAELLDNLDTARAVGSGPYQVDTYQLGVRYRYTRYDGYREAGKGLPYVDARSFTILQEPDAAEAAVRSGQAQLWALLPSAATADRFQNMGDKVTVWTWDPITMQTFNANVLRPPWNDVRVREALYRVINRQQYVDLSSRGKGKVPPGPLSAGLTAWQLDPKQTDKYFKQDAKAAKQLLDAAGFPYDKEFELICMNTSPRDNQACQVFQQQVAPLGIKVKITPLPFSDWLPNHIGKGNFDLNINSHPSYDSPQVPLREQTRDPGNIFAYGGLRDPDIDEQIFKSETMLDPEAQVKAVKDAEIALLEKYTPAIYLQSYNVYSVRYSYVKNYEINPAERPEPMYHLDEWLDR